MFLRYLRRTVFLLVLLFLSVPLFGSQAQVSIQNLDELKALAAARGGQVRVIVVLNTAIPLDDTRALATPFDRSQAVMQATAGLLGALSGTNARVVRQFTYFPMMALRVDAAALDVLARSPFVKTVKVDALLPPALDYSAEQVQAAGDDGAWERGYNGTGWMVGVLDTGVNKNHAALSGRVFAEACFSDNLCPGGDSEVIGSNAGLDCSTTIDGCGHGSHVAGIIASQNTTNMGIAPGAKIISVKVFSKVEGSDCTDYDRDSPCALTYTSDYVKGMEWIFTLRILNNYNIAAINMSLGGDKYTSQATCNNENEEVYDAAQALRGIGIGVVVSSGNDGYNNGLSRPACVSPATSVGSVTWDDKVAGSSNAASFLDLLAPGVGINSVDSTGGFTNKSGTSMAAPHVAAAFAILKQAKPNATVTEIENALKGNGFLITDPKIGLNFPRIRISMALDDFVAPTTPDWITASVNSPTKITVTWEDVTGETGFNLSSRQSPSGTYNPLFSSPLTFYVHKDLFCGTKYQYGVDAYNAHGASLKKYSSEVMTQVCPAPATVTVKMGSLLNVPIVNIDWSAVAGATGYRVQRQTGTSRLGPIWTTVAETAANDLSAINTFPPCQTTWKYRVIAKGTDKHGTPSSTRSVVTQDCADGGDLLTNGGFETNVDGNAKLPDGWTGIGDLKGDKVVTNGETQVARTGNNAFYLKGTPKEQSGIIQKVDLTDKTFAKGDVLRFSAYIKRANAISDFPVMVVKVKYGDGTSQKIKAKLATGRLVPGYRLYNASGKLTSGDITKITASVRYFADKGRVWFDNVALLHEPAADNLEMVAVPSTEQTQNGSPSDLIPLPYAPPDLRGSN